jgi:hypothetical protein
LFFSVFSVFSVVKFLILTAARGLHYYPSACLGPRTLDRNFLISRRFLRKGIPVATVLTRPTVDPRWLLRVLGRSKRPSPPQRRWQARTLTSLVIAVSVVLAACLYVRFLEVHRFLWDNPTHDRNAHYLYSLKLATDVRNGQVLQLLNDLNESRVWPPLHGMLAGAVLLAGGLDYRWAVLPSLAGWVVAMVFGFLVARRAVGRGGTVAGLIALVFIAASPAHRAFATDVMLESLGAGLTLVVLYAYLLAVQGREDETWKGRCLGLALSVLFVEKYNYWLLVVLALAAAELAARPRFFWRWVRDTVSRIDGRRWVLAQLCHPWTYALAVSLLLIGIVAWRGDRPFIWGEVRFSLYPPHNLIHVAYVLVFLRLAAWWWRVGRYGARRLDGRVRQVILWHVCPVAVWFLLPKHPSYFLWYLSLANSDPQQHIDLSRGLRQYGAWLVEDYHLDRTSALLAGGLCAAGLLAWRRVRPGGQAVLLLVVLAAALAVAHPNQKSRNLHSWLAAGWVTAGIGTATLVYSGCAGGWSRLAPWLGGVLVAGLAWMQYPALTAAGHAGEGGPHTDRPSMRDAIDVYLADLDDCRRAVILTAVPLKPMTQWTFLERHGNFDRLEEHWYGFGAPGEENRRGFAAWLRTTECDTLVYCDKIGPRDWADAGPECALHAELRDLVRSQTVFRLVKQREFPAYSCRVEVWQRASVEPRPSGSGKSPAP